MNVSVYVNPVFVKEMNFEKSSQGLLKGLEWVRTQLLVHVHTMKALPAIPTGRLQLLIANWRLIIQDPWVLENVLQHRLELIKVPVQTMAPEEPHPPPELESHLEEELSKLLQKRQLPVFPTHLPPRASSLRCSWHQRRTDLINQQ